MPGRHLSDKERRLLDFWNSLPSGPAIPYLKSIDISGGTGLRGIDGLNVSFHYPITVICGNNGSGKSTVLALAALAFHSPPGWFVHLGNTEPTHSRGDRTYYTFSNFFMTGRSDAPPNNVSITWRYDKYDRAGKLLSRTFTKKSDHWGKYNSRPERAIYYLPIGRALPANESSAIRSTFHDPVGTVQYTPLNDEYLAYLSYIMGRTYSKAEVQQKSRYKFQDCTSTARYTAFNMGGGESCMITLLHLLQNLPLGGMIVIEEAEVALHPQAQIRLAQTLVDICTSKKLQIVCSTHSQTFLDSLPRVARLLIRQSGDSRSITDSPSTRLAMYEMTGRYHPELMIYCEDFTAATMITESLPQEMRVRVHVRGIGSNAKVAHQGVSHLRSGSEMGVLCVFDGDCTDSDIESWIKAESGAIDDLTPEYILLPADSLAPETWAIQQLSFPPYDENFASQLNCSVTVAKQHIAALNVILNPHDMAFTLHQLTNLDEPDCTGRLIRSFARQHPQLDELREKVQGLLT